MAFEQTGCGAGDRGQKADRIMDSAAADILSTIVDPDGPYDLARQQALLDFLIPMKNAANQQGEDCGPVVELLRLGAATSNIAKRILLTSALGDITGEPQWFHRLFEDARSDQLPFEYRHVMMTQLIFSLFNNRTKLSEDRYFELEQIELRRLFYQLVDEADVALGPSSFAAAPPAPVRDRVVILTPQYLEPPHATTVRAREYADALIRDFGKQPIIVEAHAFPRTSPIAFVPPLSSNRNQGLGAVDTIDVYGAPVEYYKVASDCFTLSDLVHTVALVSALSPELVIAISTPYLAAEAVALRFPTFTQPTTAALPLTRRTQSFSWAPLGAPEQAVLERFPEAARPLFHAHPGFSAPEEQSPVSRAELGLPADGFAFAVVGNRLDDEVDAAFLDLLETIAAEPRAHFAMIGRFDTFAAVLGQRPRLAGRASFLGYRKDILSVLRACDAYLNPDRTGGGRSGAYAQHAGLPVLALRRGDVANTVGVETCFETYADLAAAAGRLMADPAWRADRRTEALANAARVIGVRPLMEAIFTHMGIAHEGSPTAAA